MLSFFIQDAGTQKTSLWTQALNVLQATHIFYYLCGKTVLNKKLSIKSIFTYFFKNYNFEDYNF